jgi:hypothetical protein
MSMPARSSYNPHRRLTELVGLKSVLAEIKHRLKTLALSEAVKHLEITDIALKRALIELQLELSEEAAAAAINDNSRGA